MRLLNQPSAWVPIAMSMAATAVVLGYVAVFGIVREEDEGTAAHIFQLLLAGQLPIIAVFAVKWLPHDPWAGVQVLALQAAAGVIALLPVFFWEL